MRRLVTVRTVADLLPIPGADRIELAKIDGWQTIVKKGEFQVGSVGAFFEIDCLLPLSDPRFAFLNREGSTKTHHRLKTMKMKGVLSQGLLLPLADVPEAAQFPKGTEDEDQQALLDRLGVLKYEPDQAGLPGEPALSTFPAFIRKTDLERCQNLTSELRDAMDSMEEFEVTTKLDGSSMTVYVARADRALGNEYEMLDDDVAARIEPSAFWHFGVCSRNQELKNEGGRFWEAVENSKLLNPMLRFADVHGPFALQGELIGPKIQGNPEGLGYYEFRVFDAYLICQQRYANPYERGAIIGDLNRWGAKVLEVPTQIWKATLHGPDPVEYVLKMADGPSLYASKREGIVFKSHTTGLRFKAISNQYLLDEK